MYVLPPGLSSTTFEEALNCFRRALGTENVLAEPEDLLGA